LAARRKKTAVRRGTRRREARRPTRRRSPDEARSEILKAGAAFLSRHTFRELTVERLMRPTSIGRSAFYAYFADRFALAEALLLEVRAEVLEAAQAWLSDPDDPIGATRDGLAGVVGVWRRRGPMMRAITDAAAQDEGLERTYRHIVAYQDRAVAASIRRDQAAGRIDRRLDPDETAVALNQLNLAYLNDRLGRRGGRDIAPITRTLQTIWIRTLYPDASR